jgi:hypothetical protein
MIGVGQPNFIQSAISPSAINPVFVVGPYEPVAGGGSTIGWREPRNAQLTITWGYQ